MAFQLKSDKKESEIKTIPLPSSLVEHIENAMVNKYVTISSFVLQACQYALDNIDKDN